MQVDIRDTAVFQTILGQIFSLKDRIAQKINFMSNELQKKQSEVYRELTISENFLKAAKAFEMQKQAILAQKTAQLTQALQQEAAALASGNPVAIATATAFVSKATYEEMIAKQEYKKARENRINMQRRVDIVKKAKNQIDLLYEQTKMQLDSLKTNLERIIQVLHTRLSKASMLQKDYILQDINRIQKKK